MKLSHLLLIFLLLNSINATAQQQVNPIVADTLAKKLHVKTVTEQDYYNGATTPENPCTELYDTNGRVSERLTTMFTTLQIHDFYYYNSQGQLIKKHQVSVKNNDTTIFDKTYPQDTVKTTPGKKKNSALIKYKYDSKGRLAERDIRATKTGGYLNKYFYDTAGRLTTAEIYLDDSLQERSTQSYNAKGQLLKSATYAYTPGQSQPVAEYDITPTYDNRGLMIKMIKNDVKTSADSLPDNEVDTFDYTFY